MSTLAIELTKEQAHANWIAERRTFLGGSEIFQLFNIPAYGKGCARALAMEKRGDPADIPEEKDEALLKRGHLMEPLVAGLYKEATGRELRNTPMDEFGNAKVRRSKEFPFLGVHMDRIILTGTGTPQPSESTGALEIKTHGEGPYLRYVRDGLPPGHMLQVQHGLLVTGYSWGALAMVGVFGGLPLTHFDFKADPEIQDRIKEDAEKLWNGLEHDTLPPHLADSEDLRCQVCPFRVSCRGEAINPLAKEFVEKQKKTKDVLITITDQEIVNNAKALRTIQTEADKLDSDSKTHPGAKQLLKFALTDQLTKLNLGQNEAAYIPGVGKLTLRTQDRNTFNASAFKGKHPELAAEFTKVMTTKPSLRLWAEGSDDEE